MIQKPRGTKDIFGQDIKIYDQIFSCFEKLAKTYNIQKIITPTFESYELFDKTSGETSDIVSKEIYSFTDFGGRKLALKPEGTAPIGRAIIENKLNQFKEYNKLYYIDSMYRYDKPQKGRLRQFYQIGVEFTNELNFSSILDVIVLAKTFLDNLNINEYILTINSLGTDEERKKYIENLTKYFEMHKEELSEISQTRIHSNPLRILDDKIDSKLDIVKNAPKINEFWSKETSLEFSKILNLLDKLNVQYQVDYSLVRGLDYYSNIVFEFVSNSEHLGAQSTLIGGGCYWDLMKQNSQQINGVGFGCGVERLFEIIKAKQAINIFKSLDVYFILENEQQYSNILPIIYQLRNDDVVVEYNYTARKFKKLFLDSKSYSPKLIIFQELKQQTSDEWTIKINDENQKCLQKDLINKIKGMLGE